MADLTKSKKPSSYFFNSPRLFTGFPSKGWFEYESSTSIMSPTSILDTKPYVFKNPLFCETKVKKKKSENEQHKRYWEHLDSQKVGLSIVDDLVDEEKSHHDPNSPNKESIGMVMFGSQLRIQIPPMPNSVYYPIESPKFPPDFGIKTRNTKLGSSFSSSLSPSYVKRFPFGSTSHSGIESSNSNAGFTGYVSGSETEVSSPSYVKRSPFGVSNNSGTNSIRCFTEYYVSSGSETEVPEESIQFVNPQVPNNSIKTSHVFENCVVESCCGVVGFRGSRVGNGFVASPSSFPSESFLSYCYSCRKRLGHGKDIFMYRGEKAFCSSECRYQEMLLEEEMEKFEYDDGYGACSS